MHQANQQPKPQVELSLRRRWTALLSLAMYLGVLGLLVVHTLGDEHHLQTSEQCCHLSPQQQELHYHDAQDECSLPTHSLLPSTLAYVLRLDNPRVTLLQSPHQELWEAVVARSICFYQLRAPPAGLA